ncbi:hypothetical protein C273_07782 [Staphylococcus massiliensis S46]|uniref:SprT-like domain-containing protein n=1 Tax=Staphylococcus massiliensis S46 TaxID=1229783 RepID=K9AIG3_9STAP|nr:hypothetical protein C273_07782 [Staphylococcus massiliensis S46]
MLKSHNIEINPKQYQVYKEQAVKEIVLHELCHYHLHLEGKGYQHRDQDFKQLCKKVGAKRHCKPTEEYEDRVNYIYQCLNCKRTFKRIRKVNTRKMRCGRCKGKLIIKEHVHR